MYPYFKICTYGSYQDLSAWCSHFKGLNIPYAITKKRTGRREDRYDYALWRMGTELISKENVTQVPNDERIDGDIVETWGGFEECL